MANKIEYIFSLQDKISAKLGGITATSDKTVTALSGVREKVASVDAVCKDTGKTVGSLKMKVDALQAEREWIPADNLPAIREYNKEISRSAAGANSRNGLPTLSRPYRVQVFLKTRWLPEWRLSGLQVKPE